jgi:hypothetical protein
MTSQAQGLVEATRYQAFSFSAPWGGAAPFFHAGDWGAALAVPALASSPSPRSDPFTQVFEFEAKVLLARHPARSRRGRPVVYPGRDPVSAWLLLRRKASWTSTALLLPDGQRIEAPGVVRTSRRELEDEWGWGSSRVRSFLAELVRLGWIRIWTSPGPANGLTILLTNYRGRADAPAIQRAGLSPRSED